MQSLGVIVRLQIQRSSLKTGERPARVYDPAPLLAVERLAVGPDGAFGLAPLQGWIVDVHHRAHPESKNGDGAHGLSLGFTGHYDAMRDRFGERIAVGCAGENIIVDTPRHLSLADLKAGVVVLAPDGAERIRLQVLEVAHPCRPFTGWAAGGMVESDVLKAHLQFLDDGMRGFRLAGSATAVIALGDRLALL
jgi:hypothetical protein